MEPEELTGYASLDAKSLAILDRLNQKGYPIPATISNSSMRAESERVRALESYATNTLFQTD